MSNKTKLMLSAAIAMAPGVAFAADVSSLTNLLNQITNLVGGTLPRLFFAMALAYFLYGLVNYVTVAGDEKKRTEARNTIVYGIIILFVMTSVWGLISFVQSSIQLQQGSAPQVPTINAQ